jgi:hypothetical protein
MEKPLRDWLLITVSTPGGDKGTERVYAWRALRRLGSCYLHQAVCVLPSNAGTGSAIDKLIDHLHSRGASGDVFVIQFTDQGQEARLIERFQAERSDEYGEVVERTQEFHKELELERGRGRFTYPELEESDADLARHQKWLAAIQARDYFGAAGGEEAKAAVQACERALAEFEQAALAAEFAEGSGQTQRGGCARSPAARVDDRPDGGGPEPEAPGAHSKGAPSGVQQSRLSARCG